MWRFARSGWRRPDATTHVVPEAVTAPLVAEGFAVGVMAEIMNEECKAGDAVREQRFRRLMRHKVRQPLCLDRGA